MKRREFVASSALGAVGLLQARLSPSAFADPAAAGPTAARKILIAGGPFGQPFIRYLGALTGKERPRLCYLPTAAGDNATDSLTWFENCASLNVAPFVQRSFISSYDMKESWDEVLLSMDGIVASGGNTLNQQAIWNAQGIDVVLREAWNRGIVLGGASAGSLCWFELHTSDGPAASEVATTVVFMPRPRPSMLRG